MTWHHELWQAADSTLLLMLQALLLRRLRNRIMSWLVEAACWK
jgi:hypothetical protein